MWGVHVVSLCGSSDCAASTGWTCRVTLTHNEPPPPTCALLQATPKAADGTYLYEPVWRHLLGIAPAPQDNTTASRSLVGGPEPIKKDTAVNVADCDEYANIKQLWYFDADVGALRLVEDKDLVLDCTKCTGSDREMKVAAIKPGGSPSQKWAWEKTHLVHVESGLCLARNPDLEPGLVLLANCTAAATTNIAWSLSSTNDHFKSANVCLSVYHSNTTKCQCHV